MQSPPNDKATMSAHYSGMVALFIKLLFQCGHQLVEAIQCGLQILNDIRSQFVGIGQAVQIGQGLVLDPEDVQTGLVPFQDILRAEPPPAAIGVGFRPGFLPFVAVLRVVAADKVIQIGIGHGMLLQCEMDVGAEIVNPDIFRLPLWAGGALIEEKHVCLDAGLVENAGGQAENGMQIGGFQKLSADGLPRAAFKKHVVRHHHGGPAGGFQNGVDHTLKADTLCSKQHHPVQYDLP